MSVDYGYKYLGTFSIACKVLCHYFFFNGDSNWRLMCQNCTTAMQKKKRDTFKTNLWLKIYVVFLDWANSFSEHWVYPWTGELLSTAVLGWEIWGGMGVSTSPTLTTCLTLCRQPPVWLNSSLLFRQRDLYLSVHPCIRGTKTFKDICQALLWVTAHTTTPPAGIL